MAQNCMVFNLDYDRRSDLDDSVGYWFAQPTGPASCRVFYSCEVKLRGWVPGPVYNVLTKQALKHLFMNQAGKVRVVTNPFANHMLTRI